MVNALPPEKKCARRFLNTSKLTTIAPGAIVRMDASAQKHLRFNKPLNNVSAFGGQDHFQEAKSGDIRKKSIDGI